MVNIKVLYEDNHIIAVFKPAGILSQGDQPAWLRQKALLAGKTGDVNMLDEVKKYLKEKHNKPGNVFVGLLHRLDRPVCGIMLFAKTSKGASRLSEQFRNRQVQKTYQVLVSGKPTENKGVLTNFLIKDEKLKKGREQAGGREAELYYRVLTSNGKYSLLEIKIEGGQFHQIRTQLSLAGFPIMGDVKYGGQPWSDPKAIALCATGISFRMATADDIVTLAIEPPEEWGNYI